jgi:hypothetical protein
MFIRAQSDTCVPSGSVINISDFQWRVGTSKNMTVSNVFMLSMYVEGGTDVMASSHYFNISSKNTEPATTSSSSISSATTSSSTSASGNVLNSTEPPLGTSSSIVPITTTLTANSGGLGKGAVIGMGVAIPSAVILGAAAGWYLFGRLGRGRRMPGPQNHAPDNNSNMASNRMASPDYSSTYTTTQNGQWYAPVPRQSSPPAAMTGQLGQPKPVDLQQQHTDYELSGETIVGPHYELYAQVPKRPGMNSS